MRRFLILLRLTLVLATIGCGSGAPPPEVARQAGAVADQSAEPAPASPEKPAAAPMGGSAPAPVLVLLGLAVDVALIAGLASNMAVMPEAAP
jgi:hypothetical protein